MPEFIAVGLGGCIGSCVRFAFNKAFQPLTASFPFGTLMSNVVAGLVIGFLIGMEPHIPLKPKVKLFLTTGLLGGLSTFSTFSLETVTLFQSGKQWLAAANVALNLGLSLIGVVAGMTLAKAALGKA